MTTCTHLTKAMLVNPINITIDNENLDFATAKLIADQKAVELADALILLSWYESRTGRFSPDVTCCSEEKSGWVVYAESRGGNITIDINDEQYVFIYTDLP